MRYYLFLIFVAVFVHLSGLLPAHADRVVIPMRCLVEKGVVRVEPGAVRMYRIAGQRQERHHTICAYKGSNRCRTLLLHKFKINCGGVLLPWLDVASKLIGKGARGVAVRRGQLSFRLREPSFARLNTLCAETTRGGNRVSRGAAHWHLDQTCHEFGFVPRSTISLPAGFAPLAELGGHVITELKGNISVPPSPDRNPASDRSSADGTTPQFTLASTGNNNSTHSAPAASYQSRAFPLEPLPVDRPAERFPQTNGPEETNGPEANVPQLNAIETYAPGTSVPKAQVRISQFKASKNGQTPQTVPVTLNAWSTLVEVVSAGTGGNEAASIEMRRGAQQSMVATMLGLALLTSLFSGIGWVAGRQFWRPDIRKFDPNQVMLRREVVDLAKPDAQMCGELCRTAQGLVGHIHGGVATLQGVAPLRRVLLREVRNMEQFLVTTISSTPTDPQEWRRMRLRLQRVVTDLLRLKDITDGARRSLTTAVIAKGLPNDKQEAYEVLGANSKASQKILKRLVDALRATWHPDHASDEDDRIAREGRIKQINVAWDIIQEKRIEA